MKKFFNTKITDTTWGQYAAMIAVMYGAVFGYIYRQEVAAGAKGFIKNLNKKVNDEE